MPLPSPKIPEGNPNSSGSLPHCWLPNLAGPTSSRGCFELRWVLEVVVEDIGLAAVLCNLGCCPRPCAHQLPFWSSLLSWLGIEPTGGRLWKHHSNLEAGACLTALTSLCHSVYYSVWVVLIGSMPPVFYHCVEVVQYHLCLYYYLFTLFMKLMIFINCIA